MINSSIYEKLKSQIKESLSPLKTHKTNKFSTQEPLKILLQNNKALKSYISTKTTSRPSSHIFN